MTMKEIEERMAAIEEESHDADDAKLTELLDEVRKLKEQKEEIRKALDQAEEKRKAIVAALDAGKDVGKKIDDVKAKENRNMSNIDSVEYRKAFQQFVQTGVMAPEFRDVAMTKDNGAVIPATVLNQIVEKMESFGNILPLVRKLHYAAGLVVPQSTLAAEAVWMNEGDAVKVGGKATTQITFGAYQIGAAIGISYQMQVKSLSAFEAAVVDNVARAMTKAIEKAIVAGDGIAKPQGIATTPVADVKRNVTLNKKLGFADIVNIIKAIPSAYRQNAVLTMNESTFYDFQSIVDANGQPVAKTNFGTDGEPAYMLFGRKVVVTDFLPSLSEAAAGDVVAYAFNYDNYILNVASDVDLYEYIDNPTRSRVYQSIALVDGKVADANGLVLVKAPAAKA